MNILWVTNSVLPVIAKEIGLEERIFEGWNIFPAKLLSETKGIELAIASPVPLKIKGVKKVKTKYICGYCFSSTDVRSEKEMKCHWKYIHEDFKPDIVHLQGTELPHGLFYLKLFGNEKVVASIQGMTSVYERYFYGGLDFLDILKNVSLYDIISSNSIFSGRKRCQKSGTQEIELISRLRHIIGRTEWDRIHAWAINPNIKYHFCNETLRPIFYEESRWSYSKCEKHSIFLSQCKYPIKALHVMLKAMPIILRKYPDAKIYIGSCIRILPNSWLQKVAPTNYGGLLLKLIKRYKLEDKIVFMGNLNAKEMRDMYLKSNVFVSPSSIENSPNSLCEAQILGVPTISSLVGGVSDLTCNGETTYCYRFEEYEMLAFYICEIFANSYSPKRFEIAQEQALKRHNPQENINNLMRIYNNILNSDI